MFKKNYLQIAKLELVDSSKLNLKFISREIFFFEI